MTFNLRKFGRRILTSGLAGTALLTFSIGAFAQGMGGGGGGGGGSGGGSSGGGIGGLSSGGGLTGGSSGAGGSGSSGQGLSTGIGSLGSSGGSSSGGPTLSRSTTGSAVLSQSNPFRSYYINPYSLGLGSTTSGGQSTGKFGQPLYPTTGSSGSGRGGVGGGSGGLGSANITGTAGISGGSGTQASPTSANSIGIRRNPSYVAEITFPVPQINVPQMRADLRQVLMRTDNLPSKGNIQVLSDGAVVVLRGTVQDDHERRLAESLLRLSPGVRDIVNELQVREPLPIPAGGQ